MPTTPFHSTTLCRFCSFFALGLALTILIGCAGGDPEPLPGAAEGGAAEPAAGQDAAPPAAAPAAEPEPPAVQETIQLHDQAQAAAESTLTELKAVKTPEDFKAKLPAVKKHLDAMLTHIEQANAKLSSLDAEQKAELESQFIANSALPDTFKEIGGEVTRIAQIQGMAPEVLADFMKYMFQFNQRATAIMAKSKSGAAESGTSVPPGNQEGGNDEKKTQ